MPTGLTDTIADTLIELIRVTGVIFSRKSLYQKQLLLEFGYNPWQVNKTLKRFERQGFLKISGDTLRVTKEGLSYLQEHAVYALKFHPDRRVWDKTWRILIFDIPEQERYLRDILRKKLKEWHFKKLQQSVFVTPYDCKKELKQLFSLLDIDQYVHIIPTETVGDLDKSLRQHFKLH